MNKLFVSRLLILYIIFSGVATAQNLVSTPPTDVQDRVQQDSLYARLSNRAGIALSLGISEISFGAPTLMFTSFYQYHFSPSFALEISGNMLQGMSNKKYADIRTEIISASSTRFIPENVEMSSMTHSIAGNIVIVVLPINDKHFQIGAGASFRWAGLISSSITTRLDSLSQDIRIIDTQQFAFGANAYCEYLFALGGNVDVGVRLHSQVFFPPFAFIRQREPIGYITRRMTSGATSESFPAPFYGLNSGLGAFVRIGF